MKIYLFRHGIAEHVPGKADADRALTEEGIRKLEKALPQTAEYWKNKNVRLFSSPKLRAMQTAQLLAPYLEQPEIFPLPVLAGSRTEDMLDSLSECVEPGIEHVILTGHEPFLSYWCYDLTREMLDIHKGSITVLELPDLSALSVVERHSLLTGRGRLLKYLRVRDFAKLSKLDKSED